MGWGRGEPAAGAACGSRRGGAHARGEERRARRVAEESETRLGGCGPEETAGWAGRETLGERPSGRGGRAGGEGPAASSAWMRNKAVGQARAPPARPAGGLRAGLAGAGRGEGGLRAPCRRPGERLGRPWEAVSAGPGSPAARGRGLHPSRALVTALVLPLRLRSPPPEASGGKAPGVPRHAPSRGGVRGCGPSGEVGRPRAASGTRGRVCAAVVSKMR